MSALVHFKIEVGHPIALEVDSYLMPITREDSYSEDFIDGVGFRDRDDIRELIKQSALNGDKGINIPNPIPDAKMKNAVVLFMDDETVESDAYLEGFNIGRGIGCQSFGLTAFDAWIPGAAEHLAGTLRKSVEELFKPANDDQVTIFGPVSIVCEDEFDGSLMHQAFGLADIKSDDAR